jgi:plasmid stabilization system protein ParE
MANRFVVQKRALADIDFAFAWYESREPGLGLQFAQEVDSALSFIKEQPDLFAAIHRDVRRAIINRFPYSVYYVHRRDEVKVVAVMHSARHPRSWQRRV